MKFEKVVVLFLLIQCFACNQEERKNTLRTVNSNDFAEEEQITPTLAEGLELSLWAPGPLLSNAVALTMDNRGVAYVAETSRRKSSDIDIRQHSDWKYEDLSLETIEDTRIFHLEKMATSLSDENKWLEDFNKDSIRDYRDLAVQSEYIRRVWDRNDDGRADQSDIYAEGFNDMLTGTAAGVLSFDDDIYLTVAPDLWKTQDTNGDGKSDKRESISHGYGIHIAYAGHDMSGLTMGPDGRIYWSIGDMGVNTVDQEGNRYAYPHEGAVMRANPDGSNLEVFAHGLRNPQDLSFDAFGNLISVDNDGDHPGEHERYVHILEGSDTGWRIHWQYGKYDLPNEEYKIWMDEKLYIPHFDGQAAYLLPPLALAYNGPAGLAYNPGTALSKDWEGYFFASFFTASSTSSKIQAFKLSPKGASFDIEEPKDVLGGIVPTGISFGPDGGLYLNDWKDSYAKKPEGRIWKIDASANSKHVLASKTQELLVTGVKSLSSADLENQLAYPDQRVRLAAQFELVKRDEKAILNRIANEGITLLQRIHAIWGLGQLGRVQPAILKDILPLLSDPEDEIKAQVSKVIGEAHLNDALEQVLPLLKNPNPRVQLYATEAIGKIGNNVAISSLVEMLETIQESDPHLRHAVIYALSKIAPPEEIEKLASHNSKFVRRGAVVVLRILKHPGVIRFLKDVDELVGVEAARAINDDQSIPDAIPSLAATLTTTKYTTEAFLRRAINANLREASAKSANRLARFAMNDNAPSAMRKDALWALGYWKEPLVLDRVDGSYRELTGHRLNDAHQALELLQLLVNSSKSNEIRSAVIEAMGRLNYNVVADQLYNLYFDARESSDVKVAVIKALGNMNSPKLMDVIRDGLTHSEIKIRDLIQEYISDLDITDDEKTNLYSEIIVNNPVIEKQKAIVNLGKLNSDRAIDILKKLMQNLIDEDVAPEIQLDIYNAAKNSPSTDLKNMVQIFDESLASKNVTDQYAIALEGGNVAKGRRLFIRNNSAQCLRCHAAGGFGGNIGPELTHIASQLSKRQLLESLVEPNIRLAPGYGSVYVTMNDGKEISGILQKEETDQITLLIGEETSVLSRSDIAEVEQLPSGMLNMTNLLSKDQIRDLMSFLMTLK